MAQLTPQRGVWGVHLRMTGQFQWHPESPPPCRHTRVRFWNPDGQELRFVDMRSFGEMWWVPPEDKVDSVITGLRRLGPEPFSDAFTGTYMQERLKGSSRPIKTALRTNLWSQGSGTSMPTKVSSRLGSLHSRQRGVSGVPSSMHCAIPWSRCCRSALARVEQPSATSAIWKG